MSGRLKVENSNFWLDLILTRMKGSFKIIPEKQKDISQFNVFRLEKNVEYFEHSTRNRAYTRRYK